MNTQFKNVLKVIKLIKKFSDNKIDELKRKLKK